MAYAIVSVDHGVVRDQSGEVPAGEKRAIGNSTSTYAVVSLRGCHPGLTVYRPDGTVAYNQGLKEGQKYLIELQRAWLYTWQGEKRLELIEALEGIGLPASAVTIVDRLSSSHIDKEALQPLCLATDSDNRVYHDWVDGEYAVHYTENPTRVADIKLVIMTVNCNPWRILSVIAQLLYGEEANSIYLEALRVREEAVRWADGLRYSRTIDGSTVTILSDGTPIGFFALINGRAPKIIARLVAIHGLRIFAEHFTSFENKFVAALENENAAAAFAADQYELYQSQGEWRIRRQGEKKYFFPTDGRRVVRSKTDDVYLWVLQQKFGSMFCRLAFILWGASTPVNA